MAPRAFRLDINCDLGELPELIADGTQAAILGYITQANIACGGHAGDDETMKRTVVECLEHGVAVGAHPSYPDRANFVAFVGNVGSRWLVRESIGVFRASAEFPSEGAALPGWVPGVGWSDHWSFWQYDYPAIMITDTAVYRDPNYHRPSDVASNPSYERMARVALGLRELVAHLAEH